MEKERDPRESRPSSGSRRNREIPGGMVATLSDLRPVRAMEEEMRRLDRLAALGRFATAVAHEIRNPLAAIGAGIDYLSRAVGQERSSEIGMLRSEIGRLDRIVRDLLEPAKKRPLDCARIEVAALARAGLQGDRAAGDGAAPEVRAAAAVEESLHPATIVVDEERMLQVLVNLVRNAVEASPEDGEIEIGWERERGENPPATRLWIRDHGPGIPRRGARRGSSSRSTRPRPAARVSVSTSATAWSISMAAGCSRRSPPAAGPACRSVCRCQRHRRICA